MAYIVRDFFYNAVNRISNVLPGCNQKWGHDQNDKSRLVMKPKDIVVDANGVKLDQPFDRAKHVKHFGQSKASRPLQEQSLLCLIFLSLFQASKSSWIQAGPTDF